ncbi:MAG: tripartite tricarboxylate transporter TctB family protein [Pseudomonadota bacterium]
MSASKLQHTISSGAILFISIFVAWISFTQQPADAFLFPRLISIFFVSLATWNFARAVTGMAKVGEGLKLSVFRNMVPGLVVMLIYTFFAAKTLGFYLASTITFFIMYKLYDPAPLMSSKATARQFAVTIIFMTIIYGLFAVLLKVQTPRGIWF